MKLHMISNLAKGEMNSSSYFVQRKITYQNRRRITIDTSQDPLTPSDNVDISIEQNHKHKIRIENLLDSSQLLKPNQESQKAFFDALASHLGLKDKEDWYRVTRKDVIAFGGEKMLKKLYKGSVIVALQQIYPDHKWLVWKFVDPVPSWDDLQLQKDFMDYLAQQLNITKMEQWYHVNNLHIQKHGGAGLLVAKYHNSSSEMISSIFSKHHWNLSQFIRQPKRIWNNITLQRDFMAHLAKELKITTMEDWYNVTATQIHNKGGGKLLQQYQDSPSKMITSILTEHQWNHYNFVNRPLRFWNDPQRQRQLLDTIAQKLKITTMEDWYSVTTTQIFKAGGGGLLVGKYRSSPSRMILSVFPEHHWEIQKFVLKPRQKKGLVTSKE